MNKKSVYFSFKKINSLAVYCNSETGEKIGLIGGDELLLFNIETHKYSLFIGHRDAVTCIDLSPDGWYAVSGSKDRTIRIWSTHSKECLLTFELDADLMSVKFSPEGRYIAAGIGNTVKIWNIEESKLVMVLEGHEDVVTSIDISLDGRLIISGSKDHNAKLWDIESGRCLTTLKGHTAEITAVAFCPDCRHVFSGGSDGSVNIWNVSSGSGRMLWQKGVIRSLAVDANGEYLLVGTEKPFLSCDFHDRVHMLRIIWSLDFPAKIDWDEGIRPYLQIFLTLHKGKWNEDDFNKLIHELASMRGYGWVRPDGIRRELGKMTQEYRG